MIHDTKSRQEATSSGPGSPQSGSAGTSTPDGLGLKDPAMRAEGRATHRRLLAAKVGIHPSLVDRIVERLALRDSQRDDRRMCMECAHARPMSCAAAKRGRLMPEIGVNYQPVFDRLERCPAFEWSLPE